MFSSKTLYGSKLMCLVIFKSAVAAASDDVREGVVSMAHCWGGTPDPAANTDAKVRDIGANTNRLIDNRENAERYSGIPRQSCIPVAIGPQP